MQKVLVVTLRKLMIVSRRFIHLQFFVLSLSLFVFFLVGLSNVAHAKTVRILVYGDSLVAGYGLPLEKAFPTQLERQLHKNKYDVVVDNAGVSGDTTANGLERLEWTLEDKVYDIVLLELGANDMLRLQDPKQTYHNLEKMIRFFQKKKIVVLLCGMLAKRDYNHDYISEFDTIYPRLAKKFNLNLYPFFLQNVAQIQELNLDDGIHPNEKGVQIIVKNIFPYVLEIIESVR